MPDRERLVLRRNDYTLSDDQRLVRDTFADFFLRECPSSRVRKAEPGGFDGELWRAVAQTGAITMGVPVALGGGDATLVDLALVTEQYGRYLAPVPLIEAVVALRLLSACAPDHAATWTAGAGDGGAFPTVALRHVDGSAGGAAFRQLVPAGAAATSMIALYGDDLVLVTADEPPPLVVNQGSAPLAWWDLSRGGDHRTVLASGRRAHELHATAVWEWKLLTAAGLVGLGNGALALGIDFVKDRQAFHTPIGAFQAVSHALADVHTAVVGARHLVWKAAWFTDNEPTARPAIISMAYAYAARAATKATTVGVHVQGGFGFTLESDLQLYFRRAKGWSVLGGDPRGELAFIGELLARGGPSAT